MGMNDRLLIDKINPTLIALSMMAIHHRPSDCKTGDFRVPPEFGPRGGAQHMCDTRNVDHTVNHACTYLFCRLAVDFCFSSPLVQAKKVDDICSMIRRTIHSSGPDPAMAHLHDDQATFNKDFLHSVTEELIEQPNDSLNHLSSCVATTEASVQFSAVVPMGGSAITTSSQLVPCSDTNSNNIPNIICIENTGLDNGSNIVNGSMSLGA